MKKKRSLLVTCLLVSLGLHLFLLALFIRHPLIVKNRFASIFRKSTPEAELLTSSEDDLLRQEELDEAFSEFVKPDSKEIPYDLRFTPSDFFRKPSHEVIAKLPPLPEEQLDDGEEPALPAMVAPSLAFVLASLDEVEVTREPEEHMFGQVTFDKAASADHKKVLTSSLALDEVEAVDDLGINSQPAAASKESNLPPVSVMESFVKAPAQEAPAEPAPAREAPVLSSKHETTSPLYLPKGPVMALGQDSSLSLGGFESLPNLDTYQLPEVAQASPWDDAFEVKLTLMPNPDGDGYIFSLNLVPTEEMQIDGMAQNYYFIIDRSSSIEKHRFAAYKRAVVKALSCLQTGDKFNVILFDKKMVRLSEEPLAFSKANQRYAEEFLEKQEHGGMFASSDLYSALTKIIPTDVSDGEMHTAILISDGESSQAVLKQQRNILNFLEQNAGKVTLYAAAVGKGNNLLMLDLLSTTSGGHLLYSDTHAAFPRRLGKLVLDVQNPIAKDLTISAVTQDELAEVRFYPSGTQLPTLFAKRPYEIFGTVDRFSNFTLLIQGRYKDRMISISKEISLRKALKGNRLLEKHWGKVKAKNQYDEFLREGKVVHLIKARELLKSSGNEFVF